MEITLEEKKELSQLSGYFKKLEITANHLGIDLDDYIAEYRDNGYARDIKKEKSTKTSQRKETFQKASGKKTEKTKTTHSK
jgi:hypothetical protein